MSNKSHWENVYASKPPEKRSWTQPRPSPSIEWIEEVSPDHKAKIVDVGAGASNLVDSLLDDSYVNPTVLDLSSAALREAKQRLGDRAKLATWIESDVLEFKTQTRFDIWHDRAVFHFLTNEEDRRKYVATLKAALAPNGHVIMGTFDKNGPEKCSGLDVVRYDETALAKELGPTFKLLKKENRAHTTPWGTVQSFLFCLFEAQ